MNSRCLDSFLTIQYLKARGLPFWVYSYNFFSEKDEKIDPDSKELYLKPFVLITKKDFGEHLIDSENGLDEVNLYYIRYDEMDTLRTDADLIRIYEENKPFIHPKSVWVEEIPDGMEYAIHHWTTEEGWDREMLLLKSDIQWKKA